MDPQKLHELVVDYLICEGYQEAAELLCADAQMKPASIMENTAPNLESLEQRNNIRNAIVNGNLEEALKQVFITVDSLYKVPSIRYGCLCADRYPGKTHDSYPLYKIRFTRDSLYRVNLERATSLNFPRGYLIERVHCVH